MSKRSNNGAIGGCGDDDDEDEDLKKVFSIFDKDNNGYITADELKVAMENLNEKLTDDDVNEMIREADLNNDGKVNYEGNYKSFNITILLKSASIISTLFKNSFE